MKTTEEKVFKYYSFDTHTEVLNEPLTEEEKKDLGIDENLIAHYNEIGFSTPSDSEAWTRDCFNVLVGNESDDELEVVSFAIELLPKRLKPTYMKMISDRLNENK